MRVRRIVASVTTAAMVLGGVSLVAAPASSAATCPTVSGSPSFTVTPSPTPGVDWSGCDLTDANLYFAILIGANLSGANLTNANLQIGSMSGANLTGANLTNANLNTSDLSGANLTGAFVACGTGGVLGVGMAPNSIQPQPALPAGWTYVGGVLTVAVVPCASVALEVPAVVSVGVPVTVRAMLTPATGAGSVEFLANGTSLGTAPVAGGAATLVWTPTAPGTVTLVAKYVATDIPPGGALGAGTAKVVTVVASVPGAPTGVSAAAGDAQARVSWTPPGSNGGSPLTGYVVQQSFDAGRVVDRGPGQPSGREHDVAAGEVPGERGQRGVPGGGGQHRWDGAVLHPEQRGAPDGGGGDTTGSAHHDTDHTDHDTDHDTVDLGDQAGQGQGS